MLDEEYWELPGTCRQVLEENNQHRYMNYIHNKRRASKKSGAKHDGHKEDINTLGIEDLCDRAIDMLKSGDTMTHDVVYVIELIKSRAKLLRE